MGIIKKILLTVLSRTPELVACALASNTKFIVSGDKRLLDIDGYQDIQVLKPRPFVDTCLVD